MVKVLSIIVAVCFVACGTSSGITPFRADDIAGRPFDVAPHQHVAEQGAVDLHIPALGIQERRDVARDAPGQRAVEEVLVVAVHAQAQGGESRVGQAEGG